MNTQVNRSYTNIPNREDYVAMQQQFHHNSQIDNSQFMQQENLNRQNIPCANQFDGNQMSLEVPEINRVNTSVLPGFLRNTTQLQNFGGLGALVQNGNTQYVQPELLNNLRQLPRQVTGINR